MRMATSKIPPIRGRHILTAASFPFVTLLIEWKGRIRLSRWPIETPSVSFQLGKRPTPSTIGPVGDDVAHWVCRTAVRAGKTKSRG